MITMDHGDFKFWCFVCVRCSWYVFFLVFFSLRITRSKFYGHFVVGHNSNSKPYFTISQYNVISNICITHIHNTNTHTHTLETAVPPVFSSSLWQFPFQIWSASKFLFNPIHGDIYSQNFINLVHCWLFVVPNSGHSWIVAIRSKDHWLNQRKTKKQKKAFVPERTLQFWIIWIVLFLFAQQTKLNKSKEWKTNSHCVHNMNWWNTTG